MEELGSWRLMDAVCEGAEGCSKHGPGECDDRGLGVDWGGGGRSRRCVVVRVCDTIAEAVQSMRGWGCVREEAGASSMMSSSSGHGRSLRLAGGGVTSCESARAIGGCPTHFLRAIALPRSVSIVLRPDQV